MQYPLSETNEKLLLQGLNHIAHMSIKKLKEMIARLRKNGSRASLEGIEIIKEIIQRKKQESLIMDGKLYGKNTYGMGRQNFYMHG